MADRRNPIRVTAVISPDEHERIKYWAEAHDMSVNESVRYALDLAIRHENRDYDLPTFEAQRLNQLQDMMAALSSNIKQREGIVTSGFASFVSLARGENYLDLSGDSEGGGS